MNNMIPDPSTLSTTEHGAEYIDHKSVMINSWVENSSQWVYVNLMVVGKAEIIVRKIFL